MSDPIQPVSSQPTPPPVQPQVPVEPQPEKTPPPPTDEEVATQLDVTA